jgi:hypothetical protein
MHRNDIFNLFSYTLRHAHVKNFALEGSHPTTKKKHTCNIILPLSFSMRIQDPRSPVARTLSVQESAARTRSTDRCD